MNVREAAEKNGVFFSGQSIELEGWEGVSDCPLREKKLF